MRKIETIKFDDLAEIYPIISKHEQSEYLGGGYLYGSYGERLSTSFTTDPFSLYIIKPKYFGTTNIGGYDYPYYEYSYEAGYEPKLIADSTIEERENVVRTIAQQMGYTNVTFEVNGPKGPSHYGRFSNGNIVIYTGSELFNTSNYFDIKLALYHEHCHEVNGYTGLIQEEIDVLNAVKNYDLYGFASSFYTQRLNAGYNQFNSAIKDGKEKMSEL